MNSTKQILVILVSVLLYAPLAVAQQAQPAITSRDKNPEANAVGARIGRNVASKAQATNFETPTPGQIAKFDNFGFLINSVISEDASGRIGIGTVTPGSKLTVVGRIESKEGGIKFPDGTIQTTSAAGSLFQVNHNATMSGNGTTVAPLGLAIPLTFTGDANGNGVVSKGLITVTNTAAFSTAISATGGPANSVAGGIGVYGFGGAAVGMFQGGTGVAGRGGDATNGEGGAGGGFSGGHSQGSRGGDGLTAFGGNGSGAGNRGGTAIVAIPGAGIGGATNGRAGLFGGDVSVLGNLSKGGGSFKIDHPLDPANKYLYHSFVESPDMMNVYNGNISTDHNGEATVTLPDYFEALNRDFRYQLTVIGQFALAIIASEISGNSFTIKTDRPAVKVSWQVTGIRQDAYANKHRIPVEEEKSERERGYFIHPHVFDQPEEKSVEWARQPELMREIRSRRQEAERQR